MSKRVFDPEFESMPYVIVILLIIILFMYMGIQDLRDQNSYLRDERKYYMDKYVEANEDYIRANNEYSTLHKDMQDTVSTLSNQIDTYNGWATDVICAWNEGDENYTAVINSNTSLPELYSPTGQVIACTNDRGATVLKRMEESRWDN